MSRRERDVWCYPGTEINVILGHWNVFKLSLLLAAEIWKSVLVWVHCRDDGHCGVNPEDLQEGKFIFGRENH